MIGKQKRHLDANGRGFVMLIAAIGAGMVSPSLYAQCDEGAGMCCAANGTPGCEDVACCELICRLSPFCCDVGWGTSCGNAAQELCDVCGGGLDCGSLGTGDCCSANDTLFCNDADCCATVCDIDPYCCEVEWDECCAHLALKHCPQSADPELSICDLPPMCGPGNGDCCIDNGTPGCDDEVCCDLICDLDPFCCESSWDGFCAGGANDLCDGACGSKPVPVPLPPVYSCASNCGGAAISGCWCDESCCSFGDCCEDKDEYCPGCEFGLGPPSGPGDGCFQQCGGFSGDDGCWCDESCFENGDCCPNICVECPDLGSCVIPNPADLTGNNAVGVADLLALLSNWGECQYERCFVMEPCFADFNHDSEVGVADLLFLLNNWG